MTYKIFVIAISALLMSIFSFAQTTQKPELVVQTGHTDEIQAVAFSPDGKLLASGGNDHTIKLWQVETGQELRTFSGYNGKIRAVAFSPDGKFLAGASEDKTTAIWNVQTGESVFLADEQNESPSSVAFTPDGKSLISQSADGIYKLWNIEERKAVRPLTGKGYSMNGIAVSPDGNILAGAEESGKVFLSDIKTGRPLRTLSGHGEFLKTVAFNPGGTILASGGEDSVIKLWDVKTGKLLRNIQNIPDMVLALAFSPDGQTIAAGGQDGTLRAWNVKDGREIKTFEKFSAANDCKFCFKVQTVAYSSDGKFLASGGSGSHAVKLWNAESGELQKTLAGHTSYPFSPVFSPDGKTLAFGSGDGTIRLWGAYAGGLRVLSGHQSAVRTIAFSPDNRFLASGGYDKTIKIWDAKNAEEIKTLAGHADIKREGNYLTRLKFSPDGKLLASGDDSGIVRLWSIATGAQLYSFKFGTNSVKSIAFSPDGKMLAAGGWDEAVTVWNTENGQQLKKFTGFNVKYLSPVDTVAFSPDGKTLMAVRHENFDQIKFWNVESGQLIKTVEGFYSKTKAEILAVIPDFVKERGGESVSDHLKVEYSDNGTLKFTGADEKYNGVEIATFAAIDQNDWLVTTPEGLFDGTPNAWNNVIWRFNKNTFDYAPVEAFFNEFYYPDLLKDIFEGRHPITSKDITEIDRRRPEVKIISTNTTRGTSAALESRMQPVSIEVKEAAEDKNKNLPAGEVRDVRLFRNGSLVKVWHGNTIDELSKNGCAVKSEGSRSVVCQTILPIIAGENRLIAYAFNRDDVKSNNGEMKLNGANTLKRAGTLYVLAIGANEYANSNYNLLYAVADVESIAQTIRSQQAALGKYAQTKIIELTDKAATKEAILTALRRFSDDKTELPNNAPPGLRNIQSLQPEDALIIYYAGHGTASKDHFYLIPHDGFPLEKFDNETARLKRIYAGSVSDEELSAALEPLDTGKVLLVIDACNSGQALEAEEKRRGPMNSKGLAQLAFEKGMYILTAAQSRQSALEVSKLGHGLLTYALLEGLKKADKDPSGNITERSWLDFATAQVPQLQVAAMQERNAENNALPAAQKRSELAVAAEDNTNLPPEKRGLQVPRIFYRRELEAQPLIIAKP